MPQSSKQKRHLKRCRQHRNAIVVSPSPTDEADDSYPRLDRDSVDMSDDDYLLNSEDDNMIEEQILKSTATLLQWKAGAGSHLRAVYTGDSRTTLWRKQKEVEEKEKIFKTARKITDYFAPTSIINTVPEEPASEPASITPEKALKIISQFTGITANRCVERRLLGVSKYDTLRYLSIEQYFMLSKDAGKKMSASLTVAKSFFRIKGLQHHARNIRHWAEYFLKHQTLPERKQGCHIKYTSLILDEDIASRCRSWLRSTKNDAISGLTFSRWINTQLHIDLNLCNPIAISEKTCLRWLKFLGYQYRELKKGLYHDGHERNDVVQYREAFLDRMAIYDRRMPKYIGEDMLTVIEPQLENDERRIVLVTHDESCFSAHEGKRTIWFDQDNRPIRPKGEGRSIMVSEFICECHGPMKLTGNDQAENPLVPTETVVIIKPGKNADGFWTNQDLVKQIQERAIPIFRILHPKSKMLLMFDNSQNHRALPPDALNAKVLNLNDGGKNVKLQRPGWFMKQGQRVEQMMQTNAGVQKGLRTILQERGLWENYLSKDSAKSVLEQQPDFRAQKEWIVETVEQNDGIVDFYPKFHCEFNFIEMYWAAAKSYTRRNCTYSWKDLQIIVPKALEQVPLGQIRRFARKCYRYMDAYRIVDASGNRLSVRQAEYAVKKYKRHRSLPESLIAQLD